MIAPQPFYEERGTPMNVRAMCETLGSAGIQIDLACYPLGQELFLPNTKILRAGGWPGIKSVKIGPSWGKIALDLRLALACLRRCCFTRYDLIHGIEEGGIIAAVLGKIFRAPYVFDLDSNMTEQLLASRFTNSRILLKVIATLEKFALQSAAAVITVCKALTDHARTLTTSHIAQIEDFAPDSEVSDRKTLEQISSEFEFQGKRILLYTGNLASYQGIDLLLSAWSAFIKNYPTSANSCLLVIVGGSSSDCTRYQDIAAGLDIPNSSLCFTGARPQHQIQAFLDLSTAVVSPRIEGSNTPLKVYAYMASGKPLIATRIYSHTQVLDESACYLVETNPENFAVAIFNALGSLPEQLNTNKDKVTRAQEIALLNYTRLAFDRKLIGLYAELLGDPELSLETRATKIQNGAHTNQAASV